MSVSTCLNNKAQTLTIEWVSRHTAIPQSLWQSCFSPHLEGQFWYSVLEESGLEDQFRFFYGILRDNDKAIGIVPAFLNDVPIELVAPDEIAPVFRFLSKFIPAFGYQRTLFVGSPCADEGTIGLVTGNELINVATFIHQALLEKAAQLKAPMIVWKDFAKSDESALDTLCRSGSVFKIPSYPGTAIFLEEANLDSYYKGLTSSHRHNVRKKLKRSKEQFPFDISVIQNPDPDTLNQIFTLFWQTYEHGKTKFEKLNPKFFSLISRQKESWFVILKQPDDQKIVAFMLCFLLEGKVINKFIGLDYSIAKQANLYFRLWEAAVEWTVNSGVKELQSGQTGYRFKLDTGNKLIPLFNYCQNRNPLINFIYAKVASTISWASLDHDLAVYLKAHPGIFEGQKA